MVAFRVFSFLRHDASIMFTNHVDDDKKLNMREESTIDCSKTLSRNRCPFIEDISFKSLDQRSTSNQQVYPSTLNESCENLLAAQDMKQQRQSARRRSHGIGGAGNICMSSSIAGSSV